MSLVGSLEDLGLGDILQIVGLSGKSGVLSLRSEAGEGRIVFEDGLIRSAWVKGASTDLSGLLGARGVLPAEDLEALCARARSRREGLEAVLLEQTSLDLERLDTFRREHVESAVVALFSWPSGEFCFEMRQPEAEEESPDMRLSSGLSPQRVALEGARRSDEETHEPASPEPEESPARASQEEPAAREPSEEEGAAMAEPDPAAAPPVVVVDPDLAALEWVKAALTPAFSRVHIFQRSDLGIARIRQYLARSEAPLVLLSQDAPPDPLSGDRGHTDIAARLATLAPHMRVVFLAGKSSHAGAAADGGLVAQKPEEEVLHGEAPAPALAERLRELLIDVCARRNPEHVPSS